MDSTAAVTVEQHTPKTARLDTTGLLGFALVLCCFAVWLINDLRKEQAWFAERKRRMAQFRNEARRRHIELDNARAHFELSNSRAACITPAKPVIKKLIDTTPKHRKIFKLY